MSEDLQNLLEKINREGVEKAQAKADEIIAAAKAKADALVKEAHAEAERAKVEAEKSAADYAARAAETVKQSARDTVLKVEESVTKMLTDLLAKDVEVALAKPDTLGALVADAVKGLAGTAEIALPAKLAPALKAQLAAQGNVKVVMDEALDAGFSVRIDGGRVEHAFTGEAVAAELAKRLRPDLAKLVVGTR